MAGLSICAMGYAPAGVYRWGAALAARGCSAGPLGSCPGRGGAPPPRRKAAPAARGRSAIARGCSASRGGAARLPGHAKTLRRHVPRPCKPEGAAPPRQAREGRGVRPAKIPSMRFTNEPVEEFPAHMDTLQIFSVKLAATRGALQLPLDVFGMVAIRDPVDHNRNIIFHRKRENCQTLTEKDPYLVLAGPTRAVMFALNPAIIEVDLQIKGATESEDEQLSFLVSPLRRFDTRYSHLFNCSYTSKLSTLEFKLGHIAFSVEATIFVRVVRGSWPDCYRGQFNAFTTGFTDRCPMPVGNKLSTGTGRETILLLDSGGEKLPVDGDSKIKFSRRVVSVECVGKVTIKVNVLEGETEIVEKAASFDALEAGKSVDWIDVTFCKMEVTVFWSSISCYPM